jgi:hypothetical protein
VSAPVAVALGKCIIIFALGSIYFLVLIKYIGIIKKTKNFSDARENAPIKNTQYPMGVICILGKTRPSFGRPK